MAPTYKRTRGGGGKCLSFVFFPASRHSLPDCDWRPSWAFKGPHPTSRKEKRKKKAQCAMRGNVKFPWRNSTFALLHQAFKSKEVRKKGTKHKTEGFFYLVFSVDSLRARRRGKRRNGNGAAPEWSNFLFRKVSGESTRWSHASAKQDGIYLQARDKSVQRLIQVH